MTTVIALIGSKALFLTYAWLLSAIVASFLSSRKGYGEKPGLASGLLLNVVGVVVWLLWPARPDSRWKLQGPFGRGGGKTVAEARAEGVGEERRGDEPEREGAGGGRDGDAREREGGQPGAREPEGAGEQND